MKRSMFLSIILFAAAALAFGQQRLENAEFLKSIGLSGDDIKKVQDIRLQTSRDKQQAQAELNVYKAQLEKLMLSADPDMKEVERILRDSMEWKLKAELADIKGRVATRKAVGEEAWQKIVRALAIRQRADGSAEKPGKASP
jgi:peptidoglycan hydrolase CwlO-like protein